MGPRIHQAFVVVCLNIAASAASISALGRASPELQAGPNAMTEHDDFTLIPNIMTIPYDQTL